jgi:hypothetical protein
MVTIAPAIGFFVYTSNGLAVSVCGGNPTEDYKDQEIDLFMEELGVYMMKWIPQILDG